MGGEEPDVAFNVAAAHLTWHLGPGRDWYFLRCIGVSTLLRRKGLPVRSEVAGMHSFIMWVTHDMHTNNIIFYYPTQ